jgi:hypothetical protein
MKEMVAFGEIGPLRKSLLLSLLQSVGAGKQIKRCVSSCLFLTSFRCITAHVSRIMDLVEKERFVSLFDFASEKTGYVSNGELFLITKLLAFTVSQASLDFDCPLSKHSNFARARVLFHQGYHH